MTRPRRLLRQVKETHNEEEEELPPLAASVAVGLVGVLGALGGGGVAQSTLSLSRGLQAALVAKARPSVLQEQQTSVSRWRSKTSNRYRDTQIHKDTNKRIAELNINISPAGK